MRFLAATVAALTTAVLLAGPQPSKAAASPLVHARHVIAFFDHHPKLARTPAGARAVLRAAHTLDTTVRTLQAVKAAKARAAAAFPPHHALWVCIARYESGGDWGNQDTGRNGHWGGLQMHPGWGYGTAYHASDSSQQVQEWAAERAWASSGYSYSFLSGQWYMWDGADGCGTTG